MLPLLFADILYLKVFPQVSSHQLPLALKILVALQYLMFCLHYVCHLIMLAIGGSKLQRRELLMQKVLQDQGCLACAEGRERLLTLGHVRITSCHTILEGERSSLLIQR